MFEKTADSGRDSLQDLVRSVLQDTIPVQTFSSFSTHSGIPRGLDDLQYHLRNFLQAASVNSPRLIQEYAAWVKIQYSSRGVREETVLSGIQAIRDYIFKRLPEEEYAGFSAHVEQFIESYRSSPAELPSCIDTSAPLGSEASVYLSYLLAGERHQADSLVMKLVSGGTGVKDLYLQLFQPVQHEVGLLWQTNRISVVQEHYCTAATQLIMSRLYPYIFSTEKHGHTFIGACIGEELHEIGIRMVSDFFEIEGWDTWFIGAQTPENDLLRMIREKKPDLIGLSTTLSCHIRQLSEVIEAVRSDNSLKDCRIMVGGIPFNIDRNLWRNLGADGSASDAAAAVAWAEEEFGVQHG